MFSNFQFCPRPSIFWGFWHSHFLALDPDFQLQDSYWINENLRTRDLMYSKSQVAQYPSEAIKTM